MILKTVKPVIFNKPMSGTLSEVLIGGVQNIARSSNTYFGANYAYSLEDGTVIMKAAFELKTRDEIIALNEMIKADLPIYEETPEPDFEELKVMLAFRLEMYQMLLPMNPTLKIEDIEIV